MSWKGFVHAYLPGAVDAVPTGQLELFEQGSSVERSTFAYGKRYLQRTDALPVDPVSLPLDSEPGPRTYEPGHGLAQFGAIRDAAPDFWGRRVVEAKLKVPPASLPESEYLLHAGSHRFGALDVRMRVDDGERDGALPPVADLRYLLEAADRVQEGLPVPAQLQALFEVATLGGARPKTIVRHEGRQYLAKFPAKTDAWNIPVVEHACLELARECGLDVPDTRTVTVPGKREIMLIERFDRVPLPDGSDARRHCVSALTLLGKAEQDSPASTYAELAAAIRRYGVDGKVKADQRELYARVAFNILVSNDDDHLRNHAFVWDPAAKGWRLSPLYDVVPHPQLAHERRLHLSVGPRGRAATLDNLLEAHADFGLLIRDAANVIDGVARCARRWREVFEAAGVPTSQCDIVASAFRRPLDIGLKAVERYL
jgi:serine/threonine-protein kinase HipA